LDKEQHVIQDSYKPEEIELYKFCQGYNSLERDHGISGPVDYIWFENGSLTDIISD
jgi:hypothetical protein